MNKEELCAALSKIEEIHDRQYHAHIIALMFENFGHYSLPRFNAIVKEVISSCRAFPTVNDFKKVDLEIKVSDYYNAKANQSNLVNKFWNDESPKSSPSEINNQLNDLISQMKIDSKSNEARWKENHIKGTYLKNITLDIRNSVENCPF